MKSLDAIKAACKRLGWEFREGQTKYRWWGHWVDDSPVPRHLFKTEGEYQKVLAMTKEERQAFMTKMLGHCDHAIHIPKVRYEVGIVNVNGNWTPVWDWVDGSINRAMGQSGGTLAQAYGVEASIMEAQANAYTWTEEVLEDGAVKLCVQIPDY
jgi:hypothetical protein